MKFFFNFLKNLYSIINTENYNKSRKQKKYKCLFISHVSRKIFKKMALIMIFILV